MAINGYNHSVAPMAGVTAPRQPRPIIGPRKARISRPLDAPATIVGSFGRGWRCDLAAARRKMLEQGDAQPDATVAHWIVEAPWSHEVVHSYSLVLSHLRFSLHHQPVTRFLEGATHAVDLFAINPIAPREDMLVGPINPTMWVPPLVYASQIIEPTDETADARVRRAVELVCQGRLSPHPEHVRAWAELFGDCMLRRAPAPQEPKPEGDDV